MTPTPEFQRIVVGVDGSSSSLVALRWAVAEARLRQATLAVVHAWADDTVASANPGSAFAVDLETPQAQARATLDAAIEKVEVSEEVRVERHVVMGAGAPTLLEAADGAALLVVGSRGLGAVRGMLLGSVSTAVVRAATCPVVVVPDVEDPPADARVRP